LDNYDPKSEARFRLACILRGSLRSHLRMTLQQSGIPGPIGKPVAGVISLC
jgi:hypothetical protein